MWWCLVGNWRGFIRNRKKPKSAHYLVPLMTETKPLSVQKPNVWGVWEWNLGSSLQGSTQMNYRTTKSITTHPPLHPSSESIIHSSHPSIHPSNQTSIHSSITNSSHPSDPSFIQSIHASIQLSINTVLKFIPIRCQAFCFMLGIKRRTKQMWSSFCSHEVNLTFK